MSQAVVSLVASEALQVLRGHPAFSPTLKRIPERQHQKLAERLVYRIMQRAFLAVAESVDLGAKLEPPPTEKQTRTRSEQQGWLMKRWCPHCEAARFAYYGRVGVNGSQVPARVCQVCGNATGALTDDEESKVLTLHRYPLPNLTTKPCHPIAASA